MKNFRTGKNNRIGSDRLGVELTIPVKRFIASWVGCGTQDFILSSQPAEFSNLHCGIVELEPCFGFENERAVLTKMLGKAMLDINVRDLGSCHNIDDDFPAPELVRPIEANLTNSAMSLGPSRFHPISRRPLPSSDLAGSASNTFEILPFDPKQIAASLRARAAFGMSPDSDICALSPVAEERTAAFYLFRL